MKQLDQAYYHKQDICERIKLRAELADGIFEVVYLKNVTATICSFTGESVVLKF